MSDLSHVSDEQLDSFLAVALMGYERVADVPTHSRGPIWERLPHTYKQGRRSRLQGYSSQSDLAVAVAEVMGEKRYTFSARHWPREKWEGGHGAYWSTRFVASWRAQWQEEDGELEWGAESERYARAVCEAAALALLPTASAEAKALLQTNEETA